MKITKSELVEKPENWGRHVVILGSGASVVAFPQGDANGLMLPTMDSLIEMLDLEPILKKGGVKNTQRNFESIYSELYEIDPDLPILREVENIVYTYFSKLSLPETPTLYDHLLISLRPKDIVATFNWDPFLFLITTHSQPELGANHFCLAFLCCKFCLNYFKYNPNETMRGDNGCRQKNNPNAAYL